MDDNLTPMETATENADRLIAGLVTQATSVMMPEQVELLLLTFASQQEAAEA